MRPAGKAAAQGYSYPIHHLSGVKIFRSSQQSDLIIPLFMRLYQQQIRSAAGNMQGIEAFCRKQFLITDQCRPDMPALVIQWDQRHSQRRCQSASLPRSRQKDRHVRILSLYGGHTHSHSLYPASGYSSKHFFQNRRQLTDMQKEPLGLSQSPAALLHREQSAAVKERLSSSKAGGGGGIAAGIEAYGGAHYLRSSLAAVPNMPLIKL